MYKLIVEGPDAENGKEDFEMRNQTTAYNVYSRLAPQNHVILEQPDGTVLDSKVVPDPWEAHPSA